MATTFVSMQKPRSLVVLLICWIAIKKKNLLELLQLVLSSPHVFREILPLLTIGTTEFFRDPSFFKALKDKVFPVLETYPSLNIWIAGCSSGEEIVSLSILLKEAGLLKRSTIYATDINPLALRRAQEGIYDLSSLQNFAKIMSSLEDAKRQLLILRLNTASLSLLRSYGRMWFIRNII